MIVDRSSEALGAPPVPLGFCSECDRCLHAAIARVLPQCQHRFCHSCLIKNFPCGSLTVVCPTCHTFCIVPAEGIEAFAPAPTTAADLRSLIVDSVRRRMAAAALAVLNEEADDSGVETNPNLSVYIVDNNSGPESHSPSVMNTSTGAASTSSDTWWHCHSHPGHPLRLYCRQCQIPLCDQCAECSYEHSSHTVVVLKDALHQQHQLCKSLVHTITQKLVDCAGPTKTIEENMNASDPVRDSLNDAFDRLIDSLKKGQMTLSHKLTNERDIRKGLVEEERLFWLRRLGEITEQCQKADRVVNKQYDGKQTDRPSYQELCDRLKAVMDTTDINKKSSPNHESLDKSEPNDVVLFYPAYLPALQEFVEKLGLIASRSQLNAEATARGEGLRYCCMMINTTITLSVRARFGGKLVHVDPDHIKGDIVMKNACLKQELSICERNDGNYELTYTLPEEGTYLLKITVFDRHIRGSPFSVQCVSERRYNQEHCSIHSKSRSSRSSSTRTAPIDDDLLLKVGSKGRLAGMFCNPQGICSLPDGKITVVDSNTHSVQIFSHQGVCVNKFGIRGRLPGMITRPTGVTSLSSGSIAVSDYETRYINIFNPDDGHFIGRFGGNKLLGPKGMTTDPETHKLIVVDNKASSIVIYDEATHKEMHRFGSRGSKPHQLAGPHFVAYNTNNHLLYVTDFHHHCVKVYDINGEHVFNFGCNGVGNGQFNAPTGIAIDENQNLLVADWGNNRIQVFDSNGSFVSFVNGDVDPLFGPQGVAITADGYVAVSDSGNHCYKIYRYLT